MLHEWSWTRSQQSLKKAKNYVKASMWWYAWNKIEVRLCRVPLSSQHLTCRRWQPFSIWRIRQKCFEAVELKATPSTVHARTIFCHLKQLKLIKILVVWAMLCWFFSPFVTFAHGSCLCCYCFPNKTAPVSIRQLHTLRLVNANTDQPTPSGVLSPFASFFELQRWPHVCDHSISVHMCTFYDWTEKNFEFRQICIRIRHPQCTGLA